MSTNHGTRAMGINCIWWLFMCELWPHHCWIICLSLVPKSL